jgi:hypothetical protein
VLLDGVFERVLELLLDGGVDGQVDVLSRTELLISAGLHAPERVAEGSLVARQLAGEGALGVDPARVGRSRDAGQPEGFDLAGGLGRHVRGDLAVTGWLPG